jgi:hypothetical protein
MKEMDRRGLVIAALCVWLCCACGAESEEAARVSMPLRVDAAEIEAAVNDLGYSVELTSARVVLGEVELTTSGEVHAGLWRGLERLLVSEAWAHPGHYAGGEVIGELPGTYVFDWVSDGGVTLGEATMLVGDYNGANFTFGQADAALGVEAEDGLLGQTWSLRGVARRGDEAISFSAVLAQDPGRQVVGAPFELDVVEGQRGALWLQLLQADPTSGGTLWDGIDFGALDEDGDGEVALEEGGEAQKRLRRQLQSHAFYRVVAQP